MPRLIYLVVAISTVLLSDTPVAAHGNLLMTGSSVWGAWVFTPDVMLTLLLVALIYGKGILNRAAASQPLPVLRCISFYAGLAFIALALQSPIDPLGESLFFVHQFQHLLLRMVGPLLIALAWPQGVLVAGMPAWMRRYLLTPLASNEAIRRVLGVFSSPVVASGFFIGILYFWEVPRFHNAAVLDDAIHYIMHATMLAAGLIFWWQVFDRRSDGKSLRYATRLMMLWLVILSNILLGAYTTLKTETLYNAYGLGSRMFGYTPLADEQIGGIIIWIPSSMMSLVALLIVIHMWGRHESRMVERQMLSNPSVQVNLISGTAMNQETRLKNQALARRLATFAATVFTTVVLIGMLVAFT